MALKQTFQVGDRVQLVGNATGWGLGTVGNVWGAVVGVEWDSATFSTCHADNLYLVNRPNRRPEGCIVIAPDELPRVTTDGNGKPKLPPQPWETQSTATSEDRADSYRQEALGKLALAAWYDKKAERDKKLEEELQSALLKVTTGLFAPRAVARTLIEEGWHK